MTKKMFIAFFLSAFILPAAAQKSGLYFRAGMNLAGITTNGGGNIKETNSLVGLHAGFMAHLFVSRKVAIQPALLFTGKGAGTKGGDRSRHDYFEAVTRPWYVELPVNMIYRVPLKNKKTGIFFGAGAYGALGVAGNNKAEGELYGGYPFSFKARIKYDKDHQVIGLNAAAGIGYMYRADYGWNATAGLDPGKYIISIHYGHGFPNINQSKYFLREDKNKHKVFSLSAGIRL